VSTVTDARVPQSRVRRGAAALLTVALLGGGAGLSATALAAGPSGSTAPVPVSGAAPSSAPAAWSGHLSADDWRAVAQAARAAGDEPAAQAADAAASGDLSSVGSRRAAIAALRYGSDRLPPVVRDHAQDLARAMGVLDAWRPDHAGRAVLTR